MREIGLTGPWRGARAGKFEAPQNSPELDHGKTAGEPDRLTVLTTFGPLVTKTLGPDPVSGKPLVRASYGEAARFRVSVLPARSPAELQAGLVRLLRRPRAFVIRGEPLPGTDLSNCKRLLHPKRNDNGTVTCATFR